MAGEMESPPTAASHTSSTTSPTPEKTHDKAMEAVEQARSSISHDSDAGPSEKQEDVSETPLERTQTSDSAYPSNKEVIPVIAALMLAIFLMALVRLMELNSVNPPANIHAGSNNHCYCHTANHRRIPLPR